MKRSLLLVVAVLFVSYAAFAQGPPVGYIGLYLDDTGSSWCATGAGFYQVEMWICCLPSENGQICAEFAMSYPANVIQSTVTTNSPIVSVELGSLAPTGLSTCFIVCQYGWFWSHHQTLWVTDPTQSVVQIIPHPEVGVYQFANCEPGYPTEPCIVLTNLYLNYESSAPECMGTATEESSWGAIKGLIEK